QQRPRRHPGPGSPGTPACSRARAFCSAPQLLHLSAPATSDVIHFCDTQRPVVSVGGIMNAKFLILGTTVGGIVLFVWGGLTHAVLPQPIREFKAARAGVRTIWAYHEGSEVCGAREGARTYVAFGPLCG